MWLNILLGVTLILLGLSGFKRECEGVSFRGSDALYILSGLYFLICAYGQHGVAI